MSISRRTRRRIFARDSFLCYWCDSSVRVGSSGDPGWLAATLDHVIPRAHGGTNRMGNLVTSCSPCNALRADSLGPPSNSSKPLPDPVDLERRARNLTPPAFPDGILLHQNSPQYKSYRRWWRKRGYWEQQSAIEAEAS